MSRGYKPKRTRSSGFPGWLSAASGLVVGLTIAAAVYIKDHRPELPSLVDRAAKKRSHGIDPTGRDEEPSAAGDAAKSYDFYSMLPKSAVVVPDKDKDVRRDTRAAPETRRGTYVLQAGSYKNFVDADRIRAQLALQGVESRVQKVSVDNDTWLRIRIGPIAKLDELNRLRTILRKADIDVLVIRVGD